MSSPSAPLETSDERRARQFDMLRRVAEHSMALCEKSAELAKADLDRDDKTPAAPPEPGARRPIDHHRNFIAYANAVRLTIALERRLEDASAAPAKPAAPTPATAKMPTPFQPLAPPDPRHAPLRTALHQTARKLPNAAKLCRVIDERIDRALAADPDQHVAIATVLLAIANELGLQLDVAKLADEVIVNKPANPKPDPP